MEQYQWVACSYPRSNSARQYERAPPMSGTRPAGVLARPPCSQAASGAAPGRDAPPPDALVPACSEYAVFTTWRIGPVTPHSPFHPGGSAPALGATH
jgi:hypothetical protein